MRAATKGIAACDKSEKLMPFTYSDSQIQPLKSYVSTSGARIVNLVVQLPPGIEYLVMATVAAIA
jgi:hypothetical protein